MRVEDSPNFAAKWLSTWIHSYVWDQDYKQNKLRKSAQQLTTSYNHIYYNPDKDYEEWSQLWKLSAHKVNEDQLMRTLESHFQSQYRTAFMFHFVSIQLSTFDALLFFYLFKSIMDSEPGSQRTLVLICLAIGLRIVRIVCGYVGETMLYLIGQRMYHCACQAIINKTVRTSQASNKDKITNTEISRLIHIDTEKLLFFPYKRSYVLNNVISIALNAFILVFLMSWVGLVGFFLLIAYYFLFIGIFSKMKEYEVDLADRRDTRIKKTMEIFQMIKFIKISSLQNYFYNKLIVLRDLQLQFLRKVQRFDLIPAFVGGISNRIFITIVCLLIVASGQNFNAAVVFTAGMVLNNMYIYKMGQDSVFIKEVQIALSKIEKFLRSKEIAQDFISYQPYSKAIPQSSAISLIGSFYWSKAEQSKLTELTDINLQFAEGQFIAIIGKYGSGKSSLLHCLLGELNPRSGASVSVKGKLAYVGQRSWIINGSVKENILFGQPFNESKYKEAINRACLGPDLAILEFRDETIIGERGCNLSGGQKLRIAFARALYSDADIYLFDDVLSSVDAHVGSALFNTMREHLRGRTLLLVTHSLSYLEHTDRIFLLEQGRITTSGTFEQIRDHPILEAIQSAVLKERKQSDLQKAEGHFAEMVWENNQLQMDQANDHSLYIDRNGGWYFIIGLLIFQIVLIFLNGVSNIWYNQWAFSSDPSESKYFTISIAITLYFGFVSLLLKHFQHTRDIFRNMHKLVVGSLLKSPLSYFEQTHFAKIISVLSVDLLEVDKNLVNNYYVFMVYIQLYLSTIFVALYVTIVASSLPLLVAQVLFFPIVAYIYFKCLKALRINSRVQQSIKIPVNNIFDQAIEGFSTIRAHRKEDYQTQLLQNKLQYYCHCNLITNALTSYSQMATSLTFFAFISVSMLLIYFSDNTSKFTCLLLASIVRGEQALLRMHAGITNFFLLLKSHKKCEQMASLQEEEGIYLKDSSEQDVENQLQVLIKQSDLFKDGSIALSNYSASYKTRKEKALNSLSLTIRHGERIGVVGRTGSGKSTLILSLMRSIPLAEGRIQIGGKDISMITLSDLRSNISVILQEHFLFTGTVRENIDPTSSFSDERVKEVLKLCGLWKNMEARGGLDAPVSERGDNLSAGEKQLINIARALLSPKKIVLMDEATANIDSASDEAIQKVMRQQFEGSTVVTIAHRISTVVSYDRVLVLEAGRVAEFDAPAKLLANKDSLFSKLYLEVGDK